MSHKRVWIVAASVLILLALATVTVVADPFSWLSSEDGVENFEEWIGTRDTVIGDDPDENGYTGAVVTSPGVEVPSESASDLETLPAEPGSEGEFRPDEMSPEVIDSEPQWSTFYYDFSAGSTTRPRSSSTNWAYPGSGCVYASKGTELFTLPLNLPDGVRIDYLRFYFYDTSITANSNAWITIYDGSGGITDLILVSSTGFAGYGYIVSNFVDHVVDNATYAYVLQYDQGTVGSSLRLCGLRVAYRLP